MGGKNPLELIGRSDEGYYYIDLTEDRIRCWAPPSDYRILTIEQYEAEQAQKEPLDLTKILEGCEGMELYCTVVGKVTFSHVGEEEKRPIMTYIILSVIMLLYLYAGLAETNWPLWPATVMGFYLLIKIERNGGKQVL